MKITPLRRDLKFRLPANRVLDWHPAGTPHSLFMNTLSSFFPTGERFFIDSVRRYRNDITDPDLHRAVTAFIGQEAMHGREHMEYNAKALAAGLPIDQQEVLVDRLLDFLKAYAPAQWQLAATIALEHLTALMGDMLLRHPELFDGAEPRFKALWRWHALEETEHKAVAFDVYRSVFGEGPVAYATRATALVVGTAIFWALVYPFWLQNLRAQKQQRNWRGILRSLNYQWGRAGSLRYCIPGWFGFFKPGFHPWDHDNREFLAQVRELSEAMASNAQTQTEMRAAANAG